MSHDATITGNGGGGKGWVGMLTFYQAKWSERLPRNTNSLQWQRSLSSSSPIRTPQQQNLRPSSSSGDAAWNPEPSKKFWTPRHQAIIVVCFWSPSSGDAAEIQSHRSFGPLVARLLQLSVSGPQTGWVLLSNHRPQKIEPLPRGTFVQDGDTVLHHSGSPVLTVHRATWVVLLIL